MTAEPRMALVTKLLAVSEGEYKDLSEKWRGIETKAQGAAAVSGVFLGALAGFIRNTAVTSDVRARGAMAFLILVLCVAVFFAVKALTVREVPRAVSTRRYRSLVSDILRLPSEEHEERAVLLMFDHAKLWQSVNEALASANKSKARAVAWAQRALGVALVGFAVLVLYLLLSA